MIMMIRIILTLTLALTLALTLTGTTTQGLEFDCVFILSVEDGIMPGSFYTGAVTMNGTNYASYAFIFA